jgi:hypothetical protein
MVRRGLLLPLIVSFACVGCQKPGASTPRSEVSDEQVLPITFGGFLKNGPENETLDGVCGTDDSRNLLTCDIHNGLSGWTITEVTLAVTWAPYGDGDKRYFRVPVTIQPEQSEHVAVRLGLQLPPDDVLNLGSRKGQTLQHWGWQTIGAKGRPAKP